MQTKQLWRSLFSRTGKGKKGTPKRKAAPKGGRRTRLTRRLLLVLGIFFVIIGLGWLMLPLAGHYLVVDQEPERVDVIVVLSGDRGERMDHGIRLFHAGVADRIIVSGGPVYRELTAADLMFEHASDLDVPAACIIKEGRARDTRENALYVKALMETYGFKSAVVVSSPYHMRRVQLVFDRAFADDRSRIKLIYSAAPSKEFDPNRWWETANGKRLVLSELAKLILMRLPLPETWYGYSEHTPAV